MGLLTDVERALARSLAAAAGDGGEHDPLLRRSDFADLQANFALALARRLGVKPRELAERVVADLAGSPLIGRAEVSGPGFVNIDLAGAALVAEVVDMLPGRGSPTFSRGDTTGTVVVDYSGPNVAKQMHVGHLRSTIIGDTLARVLGFLGHQVVRRNHVGDWGTQFGMLIGQLVHEGVGTGGHLDIADLTSLYQRARARFDDDGSFRDEAREWVVRLQAGDPTARELWSGLVEQSSRYFHHVYDLLDVLLTDDDVWGESRYQDDLAGVVEGLRERGLLVEHDGARCVFVDGFTNREGEPLPLIVQKADGGFGYAATDLAALRQRTRQLDANLILYVVGAPQALHLSMVFAVARAAGWLDEKHRAEHVSFGSILGADGKLLRTRAGDQVRLVDLLGSAVERADAEVAARHPGMGDTERAPIARAVGVGAVKFADLVNDRTTDYRFDLDRMVATVGATGPYLQYARARIASILDRGRDAGVDVDALPDPAAAFTNDSERALAVELAQVRDVLREVADTLEPHRLCRGLLDVAGAFSVFYEHSPVVKAEPGVRELRLALCRVTEVVLATGLDLLGISSPAQI